MTLLAIVICVVVALLVINFIKGAIKFAVLAALILIGLFVAHQMGAF